MKHNTYFGGAVQSLGFTHARGAASVGVMEPGSYEFSTGAPERMTIVSGEIEYRLQGEAWSAVADGTRSPKCSRGRSRSAGRGEWGKVPRRR